MKPDFNDFFGKRCAMNNKYVSRDKLNQIPELPGIYKMLDHRGSIIYIGKSKNLRKRVQSYFVGTHKWNKVNKMVSLIKDIEYIVTDTHLEARLMECDLIKKHKPVFNSQMKNDGGYFFIKVEPYSKNASPLTLSDKRTAESFGPFRSRYAMQEFLDRLRNFYPIKKKDTGYEFEYHLFPVIMDKACFNANRQLLLELFTDENKMDLFIEDLQKKLEEAAAAFKYEAAAIFRDLIISFKSIKKGLNGYKELLSKNIILKLPLHNGKFKLFYIANGIIINSLITDAPGQKQNEFIKEGMLKITETAYPYTDEKSWIDYRDILISEIVSLPAELKELI